MTEVSYLSYSQADSQRKDSRGLRCKKKAFLVCFTGVDGSGKTTHAVSLTRSLTANGYDCIRMRSGYRPILSYPFLAFTRLTGFWKVIDREAFIDPLEYAPRLLRKGFVASIWLFLIFLDFQIRLLEMRVQLLLGKVVVCDRYLYDILMDLMVSGFCSSGFEWLLTRSSPEPQLSFLMDVPASVALMRRTFGVNNVLRRRYAYLTLANHFGLIVIDGSVDFNKNKAQIGKATMSKLQSFSRK